MVLESRRTITYFSVCSMSLKHTYAPRSWPKVRTSPLTMTLKCGWLSSPNSCLSQMLQLTLLIRRVRHDGIWKRKACHENGVTAFMARKRDVLTWLVGKKDDQRAAGAIVTAKVCKILSLCLYRQSFCTVIGGLFPGLPFKKNQEEDVGSMKTAVHELFKKKAIGNKTSTKLVVKLSRLGTARLWSAGSGAVRCQPESCLRHDHASRWHLPIPYWALLCGKVLAPLRPPMLSLLLCSSSFCVRLFICTFHRARTVQ